MKSNDKIKTNNSNLEKERNSFDKYNNKSVHKSLDSIENEIKKCAIETRDIGIQILAKLDDQGESISRTENNIETSNYLLSKSLRIARYMSWFGWIYNWFTKDPELPQQQLQQSKAEKNKPEQIKEDHPNVLEIYKIPYVDNEAISEAEKTLAELKQICIKIGEELDNQNDSLERIAVNENKISDKIKSTSSYISGL